MKNKLLIALLALFLVGIYFVNAKSQATRPPVTYEYHFERSPSEKECNVLGSMGWELVAIQSQGAGLDGSASLYVFRHAK